MKKTILSLAIVLGFVFVSAPAAPAQATQTGYITDFGAILVSTFNCTCTGATYLITTTNESQETLRLVYMPGMSSLHSDYNYQESGVQFLGQYTPDYGMCLYYVGTTCTSLTADGQIGGMPFQGIGTTGEPVM